MSNQLPGDWITTVLGKLCTRIVNGGTPSTNRSDYWHGKTPWVTGADFHGTSIGEIRRFVSPAGLRASSTSVVTAGNLLVVTRTGVGKLAIAPFDIAISQDISGIVPIDGCDSVFMFYLLQKEIVELKKLNQGTSINGIVRADLERHVVRIPPTQKIQNKIATILQTVDEAIEKTEALIEKYSQIKAGMMQDLFTRGLTSDGNFRPTRPEAPDLYKETPIGWIPKDWEWVEMEELLAPVPNNIRSGPFGSALLKSELVEDGIPFLGIDNIHVERFESQFKRFLSERKFLELQRYAVRPRDVVITIMGTVGRCAVIPDDIERALSSKHLWTMTFNQNIVIPELICWQLNYAPWVKAWFRRETQGGIMDAIQSSTLRTLKLPLPPFPEQQLIMDRYSVIQSTLRAEAEKSEKLAKEKSGLMHDLLTGKVTVKLDEPEVDHV